MSIMRDTNRAFTTLFPPTPDSVCRYCHKPIPLKRDLRSKDWCSKEHRSLANQCVSWEKARIDTFNRDGGKCRVCGKKTWLYYKFNGIEETENWNEIKKYYEGDSQAETHHVIRINELLRKVWTMMMEDEWKSIVNEERNYWETKLYMMLYLDINNLITVCQSPCHDQIHSADYRNQYRVNPFMVAPTKWQGFWRKCAEASKIEDYLLTSF
jgi:hypothetical protein